MKKTVFFLLLSLFTAGAFASGNFEGNQKKKKKAKTAMKAHVCTNACKSGTHLYLHGEKGHTCGEACMKPKM